MDSNEGSIQLLEKFGFKKWGHMPRIAEFSGIEVGHLYYGLRVENAKLDNQKLQTSRPHIT